MPDSSASPSFGPTPVTLVSSSKSFRLSVSANPNSVQASSRTTNRVWSSAGDPALSLPRVEAGHSTS